MISHLIDHSYEKIQQAYKFIKNVNRFYWIKYNNLLETF